MSGARLFDALRAYAPDAPVLQGEAQVWRAAALRSAIDALADRLAGTRCLGLLADNGPDWVIADLAALAAGVPQVPLPTFFSPAQIAHVLTQSGADAVLTDQPERIAALQAGFAATGKWSGLVLMRRHAPGSELPAGTAKISFTSGSTGAPKGACLSADGLLDTAAAVAERLADLPIARHLTVLPLSLLLENSAGIYAPLLRGATIQLPGLAALGWRGMAGFDPGALQRCAATLQPNSAILVPELLKAWTLQLAAAGLRAPGSLAYVAVGGARVAPEALARARTAGLPAYQGYGLTECGSVLSLNRPGDDGDDVGRPLGHAALRIEDGEVVAGTRAFLGYLGIPAAAPGSGFATGDLGRLDANGHLQLAGRRKNLLITSFGRNVAPEWVEAALLAQPAIAQAVVAGEARPWLAAVLVPAPGANGAQLAAAVARANATLPDYARIGGWFAAPPFTPHNGQATGNGRPLRAAILNHHGAALAALYEDALPAEEPAHAVL
ncbi:AMP-binding protein [Azospira restricta]|uniref:AMP-binding protein n=1 Tax=Azospira restricta TaxID=404405 RepID=A0A974SNF3_9RHOO|nr:AMP-binding protein [Azospira restricta]QRJ63517.1 AMP-binding protein [Azospira restricta]